MKTFGSLFFSFRSSSVFINPQHPIAFGPIPSRRLGSSLGVNNIPPKHCSYACVYCQIGGEYLDRKSIMTNERRDFYSPKEIFDSVEEKVKTSDTDIDYITFVPDGEPTLDQNLGETCHLLKSIGPKLAIITNGSLLLNADVREDLQEFDLVSVKVDSVLEGPWKRINNPVHHHDDLVSLENLLEGILLFSEEYEGTLVTETMLVEGINNTREVFESNAKFLQKVKPEKSYILVPTRPTAHKRTKAANKESVVEAFDIYSSFGIPSELVIGFEGMVQFSEIFGSSPSFSLEKEILSICAVHPLRKDQIWEMIRALNDENIGWETVQSLIDNGFLIEVENNGYMFYISQ